MRYYELTQRPKVPPVTDRIVQDERHLQHDAAQILPNGGRVCGTAAKAKPHSASTAGCHAPVSHPGRYRCVG